VFLRLSRMPVPAVHAPDGEPVVGRAALLRPGRDVAIVASGVTVRKRGWVGKKIFASRIPMRLPRSPD